MDGSTTSNLLIIFDVVFWLPATLMRAVKYAKALACLQLVQLGWEVGEAYRDLRVNIGSRRAKKIFDVDQENGGRSPRRLDQKSKIGKKVKSPHQSLSSAKAKFT